MIEFELMVKVLIEDSDDVLIGFPYSDGQFEDGCEDDETDEDATWVRIFLDGKNDTTIAQEQFLDTSDKVIEYTIR